MNDLTPPLRLLWSFAEALPDPLVVEPHILVRAGEPAGLVGLDLTGHLLWRIDQPYGMRPLGDLVFATRRASSETAFQTAVIEPGTGRIFRHETSVVGATLLLPDGQSFVGTAINLDDEFNVMILARVSLEPGLRVLWQIPTRDRRDRFGDADVWDSGIAYADGCLYLGRGPYLVCLDAETGKERWRGSMAPVAGAASGGWDPFVVGHRVIVNGLGGTIAFHRDTGEAAWTSRVLGSKAVFRDQLYFARPALNGGTYVVLDAESGTTRIESPLVERIRNKYGAKSSGKWRGGTLFTRPAVSETHVFFGDDAGRLWAIERDTGEPVWYHKPKGNAGYLAATPIISGKRLYVTSFSMDTRRPQALYCYEEAGG
jgi:outer membrane protein assembly factor BamB